MKTQADIKTEWFGVKEEFIKALAKNVDSCYHVKLVWNGEYLKVDTDIQPILQDGETIVYSAVYESDETLCKELAYDIMREDVECEIGRLSDLSSTLEIMLDAGITEYANDNWADLTSDYDFTRHIADWIDHQEDDIIAELEEAID